MQNVVRRLGFVDQLRGLGDSSRWHTFVDGDHVPAEGENRPVDQLI